MIHVQIASQVNAVGVDGIRWVLVEAVDGAQAPEPTPAAALSAPGRSSTFAQAEPPPAGSLQLNLLKGLVILLGLGAALGMARLEFGPPTVRWWRPAPALTSAPPAAAGQAPSARAGDAPGGRTDGPPARAMDAPSAQPAPAPAPAASGTSLIVKANIE